MSAIPNFDPVAVGNEIAKLEAEVQNEFAAAKQAAKDERSTAKKTADSEYVAATKAAEDKYKSRSKEVAELLWSVKQNCPDILKAVCARAKIGRSRKFELLQIGNGDKTVEQSRKETAERQKKFKAKKKKESVTPPKAPKVTDGPNPDEGAARMKAALAANETEMPSEEEAEESWQNDVYSQACLLLEQMADKTRQKFFAHIKRKYEREAAGLGFDSDGNLKVMDGEPEPKMSRKRRLRLEDEILPPDLEWLGEKSDQSFLDTAYAWLGYYAIQRGSDLARAVDTIGVFFEPSRGARSGAYTVITKFDATAKPGGKSKKAAADLAKARSIANDDYHTKAKAAATQ